MTQCYNALHIPCKPELETELEVQAGARDTGPRCRVPPCPTRP
jgi:hypothetical protein